MGYTALLFCPDDKNARLVTQVLSELEFTVEACAEPFAAVKKLMSQHFDAVVVDCDNEQNATLLFKSARNSTPNQTSLAVAVVEGQAGVAKAFRIGANLVLTKPINIEQAKGTLRVARGLLRKAEPTKTIAVPSTLLAAAPAPAPASIAPKPAAEVRTAESVELAKAFASEPDELPPSKPTPNWTSAGVSSRSAADDDLLEIDSEPAPKPAVVTGSSSPILGADIPARALDPEARLALSTGHQPASSGAASAPAPAREAKPAVIERVPEKPASPVSFEKPAPAAPSEPAPIVPASIVPAPILGSAPSFGYGAAESAEKSGGGKKIAIGIAAAVIVAAGLYFGWEHFHGSAEQSASPAPAAAVENRAPITPSKTAPTPAASAPVPNSPSVTSPTATSPLAEAKPPANASSQLTPTVSIPEPKSTKPAAGSSNSINEEKSSTEEDNAPAEKAGPAPLVVKGGRAAAAKPKSSAANAEADAPSMVGMAAPVSMPAIPTNTTPSLRPNLQALNISQGVSQGLLIKKVSPNYPANALRMGIEGRVELLATISSTGEITHVKVMSGDPQLTKPAADAVKQWKYKPYLLNGEPVEIQTQITVNFKLPR